MLVPFPELLSYGIFAPFILRVALGLFFLFAGSRNLSREKREEYASMLRVRFGIPGTYIIWYLGLAQILVSVSLILGMFVQAGALLAILVLLDLLFLREKYPAIANQSRAFYLIGIAVSISLLLTGAGYPAFDLPL